MKHSRRLFIQAWLIWLISASFYSYEFFLRISPAVMTNELMRDFATDATLLGSLSAFYYYAYASMQIPIGLLLDRFGIRRLLSIAALVVSGGCFLFAYAHQLWLADISRILMGLGSAFSFIACLKLITNWFKAQYSAMVIGLTSTLGTMGAIFGDAPLAWLVEYLGDWRAVMLIAAGLGLVITTLIALVIRDKPMEHQVTAESMPPHRLWETLLTLLTNRQTWIIALIGGLMVAPVSAFTELWSVPFLSLEYHLAKPDAAFLVSLMFVGIACGGPIHGFVSGLLGRRKPVLFVGIIGELVCLLLIIYIPSQPLWLLGILLILFGIFTSSMLLCFAINTELQPAWATGITIGFTNMLVMAGGTIFQPLVGYVLDKNWNGAIEHGEHIFTVGNYEVAFILYQST